MEDSIIFNQSSIDRGIVRSVSFKKFQAQIQKNQITSQDDVFIKPDPDKVAGMKHGSYDKLDDYSNIPEENEVKYGDIIIGKVTPMQAIGSSQKIFRDSSTIYKDTDPGIVDKIWSGIYNNEGYEMRKMRIRSERIPNIGDKMCCYSSDHDILTEDGWIGISEITKNHKVACLIDNKLEYEYPTEIQEYDYDGQMYNIETNHVSLTVTQNHRMYLRQRKLGSLYKIEKAEDIIGKARCYKKNADTGLDVAGIDYFILESFKDKSEKQLAMNDWLIMFGIWIAEGTVTERSICFATHKTRVKTALVTACQNMNFNIKYNHDKPGDELNKWCIHDIQLANYFKCLNKGAINKYLPDWVWKLNKTQCQTLIHGMVLGDGHTMNNGTRRYDTSSKKLANDFQRLCLHAGYSSNITIKYKAGHITTIKTAGREGETIRSTVDAYRMTIIESQNEPCVNKTIKQDKYVKFNGKVYCCTVPGEGIIYVRRNGKPIWCGNSRH